MKDNTEISCRKPIISFWVDRITAYWSMQIRSCSSWGECVHKQMKMLDPSFVIVLTYLNKKSGLYLRN